MVFLMQSSRCFSSKGLFCFSFDGFCRSLHDFEPVFYC